MDPCVKPDLPGSEASPSERILDAALETIAERTISGTRMREIARRAGVSQGHLHYYFPSKDQLFLALLDHMEGLFNREQRDWLDDPTLSPRSKLELFLDQQRRLVAEQGVLMRAYQDFALQGATDPQISLRVRSMHVDWRSNLAMVLAEGVDQGVFDADRAGPIPGVLVSLMEGSMMQYLIDPQGFDLDSYFGTVRDMILGWLRPDEGAGPSS